MPPKKDAWGSFTPAQWTKMLTSQLPVPFSISPKVRIASNTYAKSITPCVWQQAEMLNAGILDIQEKTKPHHCSYCGLTGHNIATCPKKHDEAAAELEAALSANAALKRDNRSLVRAQSMDKLSEEIVNDLASRGSSSRGSASRVSKTGTLLYEPHQFPGRKDDAELVKTLEKLQASKVGLSISMDVMFRSSHSQFKRQFQAVELDVGVGIDETSTLVSLLGKRHKLKVKNAVDEAMLSLKQTKKRDVAVLEAEKAELRLSVIDKKQDIERRSVQLGLRSRSASSSRSGTENSLGCSSSALNI